MNTPATKRPGQLKRLADNYRSLAILALVFFSVNANAQIDTTVRFPINGNGFNYKTLGFTNGMVPPRDTFRLSIRDTGAFAYKNGAYYQWNVRGGVLRWDSAQTKGGSGGIGSGTDSASNAGYGIIKTTVGTVRVYKTDTATLFPQLRATIPAGGGSTSLKTPTTSFKIIIPGTDSAKVLSPGSGILIDSATPKTVTFKGDTSLLSTVAKMQNFVNDSSANKVSDVILSNDTIYQKKNGVRSLVSKLPPATVANSKWKIDAEASTVTMNLDSPFHKVSLTANRLIAFTNLHEGSRLELEVTHTTAGTKFTNMPNLPWDFYWATGAGERTIFSGIYDSVGAKWNYNYAVVFGPSLDPVYATHLQLAFTPFSKPSRLAYLSYLKNTEKKNLIWAYSDDYNTGGINYIQENTYILDTAAIAGISVMPGIDNSSSAEIGAMVRALRLKPAMYKIGGVPVFCMYYFTQTVYNAVVADLATSGIVYGRDYIIMAHMLYPQPDGLGGYTQYGGNLNSAGAANNMYSVNGPIYGIVNFAVDKGSSTASTVLNQLITEDSILNNVGISLGKWTFAGVNMDYTSAQYTDFGWDQLAEKWYRTVIRIPVNQRPNGVMEATAADYKERSYMSKAVNLNEELPGLTFVPAFNQGFSFGPNISCYPALSHEGVYAFQRPFIEAYLNKRDSIVINTDEIFIKYPLHFRAATPTSTPPTYFTGRSDLDAAWMAASPFGTTPSWVGAGLIPNFDKIRVACFLTAPAQIRINSTLSGTTFPAGIAYFEISLALGTPTVDIVRSGVTVASGTAPQAVTTSTYPGGYSFMEVKIY